MPTPTAYHVVLDEIQDKIEDVQELMYKLCYMDYNYSGGVKLPAPLRYS